MTVSLVSLFDIGIKQPRGSGLYQKHSCQRLRASS
jgi:hypothetical protein